MEQKLDPTGVDAYKPAEVALRIEEAGVKKATLPAIPLLTLSVLAGAFTSSSSMRIAPSLVCSSTVLLMSFLQGAAVQRQVCVGCGCQSNAILA